MTRHLQYGKFGLKENPIGYVVSWMMKGEELTGVVASLYRVYTTGAIILTLEDGREVSAAIVRVPAN